MIKRFIIFLLTLGILPVIFNQSQPDQIRYEMKIRGIRVIDMVRGLHYSQDYIQKTISGRANKRLPEIIQFINERPVL